MLVDSVIDFLFTFQSDVNTVAFADESGNLLYSGSDDNLCKVAYYYYFFYVIAFSWQHYVISSVLTYLTELLFSYFLIVSEHIKCEGILCCTLHIAE